MLKMMMLQTFTVPYSYTVVSDLLINGNNLLLFRGDMAGEVCLLFAEEVKLKKSCNSECSILRVPL